MSKLFITYLFFICTTTSLGQNNINKILFKPGITFSTKQENIKWVIEKLNRYSLNDIVFKCDNRVYDKYSNFLASFNDITNELTIKYEYRDTIKNLSSSYLNILKVQNFKQICQTKQSSCENKKYFQLETNCKCIEVQIVSSFEGQIIKQNFKDNKIYFYFDDITEKDILANINIALLKLKKVDSE